jgi:hypothetical protein
MALKISANSTFWMADLFLNDMEHGKMEKRSVLMMRVFRARYRMMHRER